MMRKHVRAKIVLPCLAVLLVFPGMAFGDSGKQKIKKIIHSPALESTNTGIKVISLASGKTLFEENGSKLFIPASNEKIITAYGALKVLPSTFTFPVEFSTDSLIDSNTVHNLYIREYGDPSVTLADVNFQAMALSEKIKLVTGDIIVDASYFDSLQFGRGWMWDDGISSWNAPISPYAVNGNCIDIRISPGVKTGSPVSVRTVPLTGYAVAIASMTVTSDYDDVRILRKEAPWGDTFVISGRVNINCSERLWKCAVSRPGLYTGTLFKELLGRYGVKVNGSAYEAPASSCPVLIERFSSRSIIEIVRAFVKDSNNLSGECLLKTMGAQRYGAPGDAAKGIMALQETLNGIGIKENTYTIADGSGMSTYNQISPNIMIKILRAVYDDFSCYPEFAQALSVAGVNGTLQNRLKTSPAAGNIRAKTGTMSGVSCVSGYIRTRKGEMLAFSIMMNGCAGPAKPLQDAQDEILKTLWESY